MVTTLRNKINSLNKNINKNICLHKVNRQSCCCLCCCCCLCWIQHASSAQSPYSRSERVWHVWAARCSGPHRSHWSTRWPFGGYRQQLPTISLGTQTRSRCPVPHATCHLPHTTCHMQSNNKLQMKYTRITRRA